MIRQWLLAAVLLSVLMIPLTEAQERIRITNGEWPPYMSEHLPHYGIASQIVTEAFALEGVEVEYGFFPWGRSYILAQAGVWDASAVWLRNEERERLFYLSDPVVNSDQVFFHRIGQSFDWERLEDLVGYVIGGSEQYSYGDEFMLAAEAGRLTLDVVPSDEQNLRRLLAGRIDLFPMSQIVGQMMMNEIFTPEQRAQITYHPRPLTEAPLHLIFSRQVSGNEILLQRFNRALSQLREQGRIEQIIQQHLQ